MLIPKNITRIYGLVPEPNLTTLIIQSVFNLKMPFPKCCEMGQFFSTSEGKCAFDHANTSFTYPNLSLPLVQFGLPCLNSRYDDQRIKSFSSDGTGKNRPFRINGTRFKERFGSSWAESCIDMEKETGNPVLIECSRLHPVEMEFWFVIPFVVSLLLAIITFSIYLAESELRKKVKNKCLICFLAFLVFSLLLTDGASTDEIGFCYLRNKLPYVHRFLFLYCIMGTSSWLNVMCFHLWLTVRSVHFVSGKIFRFYALYAMGLPLITSAFYYVDVFRSGEANISRREDYGEFTVKIAHCIEHQPHNPGYQSLSHSIGSFFSNPLMLYLMNICALQFLINIGLFARVGYIIWNQKQKWYRRRDCARTNRIQKTMFSRLSRLSIMMGLDWTIFFLDIYVDESIGNNFLSATLMFPILFMNVCPGYLIFILYVCCDKKVWHMMRKRISNLSIHRYEDFSSKITGQKRSRESLPSRNDEFEIS